MIWRIQTFLWPFSFCVNKMPLLHLNAKVQGCYTRFLFMSKQHLPYKLGKYPQKPWKYPEFRTWISADTPHLYLGNLVSKSFYCRAFQLKGSHVQGRVREFPWHTNVLDSFSILFFQHRISFQPTEWSQSANQVLLSNKELATWHWQHWWKLWWLFY